MTRTSRRLLGVVLAGALAVAACGDDDDDSGEAAATTQASESATTAASTSGSDSEQTSASTAAPAASTTEAEGAGLSDATLNVGAVLAPVSLDLTRDSGAGIPQLLLYNVYETLVKINDSGEFEELLAESYELSDDGLTYTFTLRDGVTFQSGKPMTSADVKFSFDRNLTDAAAPSIIKETFSKVATVEAPDPATVVVTLKERSRNFLYNIAQTSGVIINEAGVADLGATADGTGPFEVTAFSPPDTATLTRFDGYWGEPAQVAEVQWRYITDASAMAAGVQSGEIDIVTNLAPELFPPFADDDNYKVVDGLTNGETILAMNNSKAPLDDVRVRQAISHAINKEDVLQAAESGYGQVIGTHSSPSDPWFEDLSGKYPYDPERARQLLAEAGVSDITLTLRAPPPPYAQATAPIVQSQLADVGITVQIENVQFPLWIEEVFTNANYDLTIISHVEARDVVRYGDAQYYWRYDSPEVQTLLAEADAAPTEAESDELYQQVLNRIADDAVNDWLFVLPNLQVIQPNIEGYPENAYSLSYDLSGISKT